MIALLVMPCVIEMSMRGVIVQMAMSTIMTLAIGTIAEGDMCALAWLPYVAGWI